MVCATFPRMFSNLRAACKSRVVSMLDAGCFDATQVFYHSCGGVSSGVRAISAVENAVGRGFTARVLCFSARGLRTPQPASAQCDSTAYCCDSKQQLPNPFAQSARSRSASSTLPQKGRENRTARRAGCLQSEMDEPALFAQRLFCQVLKRCQGRACLDDLDQFPLRSRRDQGSAAICKPFSRDVERMPIKVDMSERCRNTFQGIVIDRNAAIFLRLIAIIPLACPRSMLHDSEFMGRQMIASNRRIFPHYIPRGGESQFRRGVFSVALRTSARCTFRIFVVQ